MYFHQLRLQQIGRFFDETAFEFQKGLNVIIGPNEAGKSTVVKSLETTLFGFKPMKDWKYASWQGSDAVISAVVENKGISQEVVRRYGSKIRGSVQSGHVAENIGNQPLEGHLVDLDIYKAMFSMSVDELSGIDKKSWKELTASLTDAYNHSAFKSAAETQELVLAKASEIYKENGRGQYILKQLGEQNLSLEGELKQLEIERAYAEKSQEERKQIADKIALYAQEIQHLDAQIQDYEANHKHIRLEKEYVRKSKDLKALDALELPELETVDKWTSAQSKSGIVKGEIDRIEGELERLAVRTEEAQAFYDEAMKQSPKLRYALAGIGSVATLAYGYYALPNGLVKMEQGILSLLLVITIIIFANAGWVTKKSRKADLKAYDYKMTEISQSRNYVNMQMEHLKRELSETEALCAQAELYCQVSHLETIDEVRQWTLKAMQLRESLELLRAELPEGWEPSTDEHFGTEDVGLKGLLEKRDMIVNQKAEAESLLAHQTNLSVREIDFRISVLKEKLGDNASQMMAQAYERDRLLLVSRIVAEAERHYRKSQKPDFLIRASRFIALLTAGTYEEILMTEGGSFVLKSGTQMVPITESISRGTREQMYLALKLAMTFRLDPLGEYPILMDELVINFDENRRKGFYNLLKELSEHRQIIFLTCHEWLMAEMKAHLSYNEIRLSELQQVVS